MLLKNLKSERSGEGAMSETRERVHIEHGPKRVRTYLGGEERGMSDMLQLVVHVPDAQLSINARQYF